MIELVLMIVAKAMVIGIIIQIIDINNIDVSHIGKI